MIAAADLLAICPRLGANVNRWIDPLNSAMETVSITTPARESAFLAQAAHESNEFTQLEESLNYGGEALVRVFDKYFDEDNVGPYIRNPRAIANRVYANRMGNGDTNSGDGWRYRGRGIFQITGRDNYRTCSIAICNEPMALLDDPDMLTDPDYACISAAWYWSSRDLNKLADAGNFDGISDLINLGHVTTRVGDAHGAKQRVAYFDKALEVLA